MSQDLYDVELDLTYANDSAIDQFEIRLPGNNGSGTVLLNNTPGYIPPNADVPHMFHDVVGARLGGDWNVIPDKLALRAGAYTESAAMRAEYQNIDFPAGPRIGWAGGAAYRIHFARVDGDTPPGQRAAKTLEIMLGFMHTLMFSSSTSDGQVKAIAGTQCLDATQNNPGAATCKNGLQSYRTTWSVNNGTITNAVNLINLGASYRF
jgi:long-chain fatty acid transport protein